MKALIITLLLSVTAVPVAQSAGQPQRELELGTLVSGVVAEVKAREGQQVEAGEELVILDQREFQARLNRARAVASRAEALFAEALREEERARELYDQGLLSDHELQKAQIGRLEAEARRAEARAEETQAALDLERSHVRAPQAGRIVTVHAWKGQPVRNALAIQPLIILRVAPEATAKAERRLP
ncbi:efflux RND transporter periplasmic adaptor subunit [Thiolapillus sp.]